MINLIGQLKSSLPCQKIRRVEVRLHFYEVLTFFDKQKAMNNLGSHSRGFKKLKDGLTYRLGGPKFRWHAAAIAVE